MATSTTLPQWQKDSFLPGGLAGLKREATETKETDTDIEARLKNLRGRSMSPDEFRELMARLENVRARSLRFEWIGEVQDFGRRGFAVPKGTYDLASEALDLSRHSLGSFESAWRSLAQERVAGLLKTSPGHAWYLGRLRVPVPELPPGWPWSNKIYMSLEHEMALYSICYKFTYEELKAADDFGKAVQLWDNLERAGASRNPRELDDLERGLPTPSVDTMLHVASEAGPEAFREHLAWKAGLLGRGSLTMAKLLTVPGNPPAPVSPKKSLATVISLFRGFDPALGDLAARVQEEGRLSMDSPSGRTEVASFTFPAPPGEAPWVYSEQLAGYKSVFALARQLMKAAYLMAAGPAGALQFIPSGPMMEAAGSFAETLLFRALMDEEKRPERRKALACLYMGEAYDRCVSDATLAVFHQESFRSLGSLGEREGITDFLVMHYRKLLSRQLGDMVAYPKGVYSIPLLTHHLAKPHMHYDRVFGSLLAFALWERYESKGAAFVPKFLRILSRGGSASPQDILAEAGMGPLDEKFWRGCLKVAEKFTGCV
ncbi:MAG: hypothetical protein LBT40_16855 [Deltaproteobacteria bacterium]|jgi:hypothetical protein|nr:hypothetical protein [Deltaproteobacteria bacterium]